MSCLQRAFNDFNHEWFNGSLPHTRIEWAEMSNMGSFDTEADGYIIRVNERLKGWPSAWKQTLLHEMMHLATADEPAEHGPRWLKLRDKMIRKGAFTPYI